MKMIVYRIRKAEFWYLSPYFSKFPTNKSPQKSSLKVQLPKINKKTNAQVPPEKQVFE